MKYLVGIDLGTSATKTIMIDEKGKTIASDTYSCEIYQRWAEQDPEDWKNAAIITLKNVISKAKVNGKEVVGIGISGQMHGLVMLDENNSPIRKTIIWCDQRSGKQVNEMLEIMPKEKWLEITANPPLAAWTAAKILWVRENEPEIYKRCKHIMLPKDYINLVLTGKYSTDVSDASGMQLLDVKNRCWSVEILKALNIDASLLGTVYESQDVIGKILPEIAEECGLSKEVAVVAGASDNAAAGIGTGVVHNGNVLTSLGTSGVVYTHVDKFVQIPNGSLHVCCCAVPGCWHTMGTATACGLSVEWFKNSFCQNSDNKKILDILTKKIESIPIGSEKLIYIPHLMGERTPHMSPNCRGVFFGLNTIHKQEHLFRAILEGITYALNDGMNILKIEGVSVTSVRACGGGSKNPVWRQIIADLFKCDVRLLKEDRGPSFGAALLAGTGTGLYKDIRQVCDDLVMEGKVTKYSTVNAIVYEKYQNMYDKIYDDLSKDFDMLASIG